MRYLAICLAVLALGIGALVMLPSLPSVVSTSPDGRYLIETRTTLVGSFEQHVLMGILEDSCQHPTRISLVAKDGGEILHVDSDEGCIVRERVVTWDNRTVAFSYTAGDTLITERWDLPE